MSKELDKLEQLFHGVLDLASEEERAEYLARACGSDAGLRQRVEKLLQAHQTAGGFLSPDTPPVHGGLPMSELDLPPSEKPGDQIGRYTLLERIGEGGSCVVYRAGQDEPVRRQVALKLIKAGMDTRQVVARFEIERQTLALMDHPHIARVFDAGVTPAGRPYFVMELVHGIPITRFCEQQRLTLRQRLELFTQVCQAVQHAHQKGIIHRDLKPSNILVTNVESVSAPRVTQPARDDENSGRPRAKPAPSTTREQPAPRIIDFGIAKAVQSSITGPAAVTWAGQFVGTPAYMSPEQAAMNGDIDVRSDIYSLGALLYELLTGVTAFDQESLSRASFDEIRRTILETEPPKPSTRLKELSSTPQSPVRNPQWKELRGDLDWIVMKAMDKDRGRRYETANDFAGDVQRFLAHEPVQAGPPTATYRARKFVRRHRVGVVMAAAVTMALLAGLALALMGLRRARQAESVAHLERDRAVHAEEMMRQERDRAIQAETDRRGILSLFDERLGANEDEMAPYYDAARLARERLQPTNPATMNFILPLGRNLGRRGAWSDTLEVYLWLSKAASWNCDFQTHAHAAALAGGRSEVRAQLLFEIVARFGDTWDTITAMQVARAVLIDPDFQKHRKTGVDCAAKAFREAPEYAWSRIVQGMGEYRCGRWPEAIKVLEKAERDPDPRLAALAGSFGAMARYQAGQTNAARESLDRASQLLNRLQQTGVLPGNEWHFVVFGLVARAEAERLILGREVSPPVTVESLAEVRRQWKVVRENLVMGEALAVQGNWNASRDAYVRALDNPSFDWDAAEDESPVRCLSLQMSTVFARVGDKASHERLCRLFLRMNPGGQGSLIAERRTTPWAERYTRACFIFAQGLPSELRQPALELARFAVANQATHQDNHAGWTALAGGMAEYHAGPPERAMELLRVTESDDSAVLRSLAMAYHAMALHKLNRPTEALRLLKEAEDLISKNPQNLHSTQCWWDAEQCRLALEEARRLIQPGTK